MLRFADEKKAARSRSLAKYLLESILQLGPTFIKVGQLSSTRSDLFPAEFVEELSKLQDRVPAFSSDKAVAIIEKDLGQPIDQVRRVLEESGHLPLLRLHGVIGVEFSETAPLLDPQVCKLFHVPAFSSERAVATISCWLLISHSFLFSAAARCPAHPTVQLQCCVVLASGYWLHTLIFGLFVCSAISLLFPLLRLTLESSSAAALDAAAIPYL